MAAYDIPYVYEVDELKALIPIEAAAAELGISFREDGRALCPFHDDQNNPNFELMGPGEDGFPWAYCRACGTAVDVIELVKRVKDVRFYEATLWLSQLAAELPDDVPTIAPQRRSAFVPDETWEGRLEECVDRARSHAEVGLLSFAYGFVDESTPPDERQAWDAWLIDWGWGLDEAANVVIPHRDHDGRLTAVKVRYRNKDWKTFGPLKHLYGVWRAIPGAHSVLLCEGESDCVWAARQRPPGTDVFALPSGAGSAVKDWAEDLERYEIVYLAMDEDPAGRESVRRWGRALHGCEVRRVALPEGADVRSHGAPVTELMTNAERMVVEE
jgi:DNA primase